MKLSLLSSKGYLTSAAAWTVNLRELDGIFERKSHE